MRLLKRRKLTHVVGGTAELNRLAAKLWPDEWPGVRRQPLGRAVAWLNARTGLAVPGDAPAHFGHWLPRLREMAGE